MRWIGMEGLTHNERAVVSAALTAILDDDKAMSRLYRTAEMYARVPGDSTTVRELVWDVVGDVLLGEMSCDLARDLYPQLEDVVRRRANRMRRDAQRAAFIPLDEAPSDALAIDAGPHGTEVDEDSAPKSAELVARIREYARDDDAVLQLLEHYQQGLVLRREVLGTGMTQWAYRAARKRLAAYAAMAANVARSAGS
jgi:hypothetical protein